MCGSWCRRWLETLADVTMAVIPAFIKFFAKVLSFDFDLGVPATLEQESKAIAKGDRIADQFPQLSSKSLDSGSLLKAGSRVSMGMWLGRRTSSTSESSVRLCCCGLYVFAYFDVQCQATCSSSKYLSCA